MTEKEERILGERVPYVKKACGCPACNYTGYRGRVAVHEILQIDRQVRRMIMENASSEEIKEYAVNRQHMRTLKQCAMQYLREGITTVEEVAKVAYYEE